MFRAHETAAETATGKPEMSRLVAVFEPGVMDTMAEEVQRLAGDVERSAAVLDKAVPGTTVVVSSLASFGVSGPTSLGSILDGIRDLRGASDMMVRARRAIFGQLPSASGPYVMTAPIAVDGRAVGDKAKREEPAVPAPAPDTKRPKEEKDDGPLPDLPGIAGADMAPLPPAPARDPASMALGAIETYGPTIGGKYGLESRPDLAGAGFTIAWVKGRDRNRWTGRWIWAFPLTLAHPSSSVRAALVRNASECVDMAHIRELGLAPGALVHEVLAAEARMVAEKGWAKVEVRAD